MKDAVSRERHLQGKLGAENASWGHFFDLPVLTQGSKREEGIGAEPARTCCHCVAPGKHLTCVCPLYASVVPALENRGVVAGILHLTQHQQHRNHSDLEIHSAFTVVLKKTIAEFTFDCIFPCPIFYIVDKMLAYLLGLYG